MNLILLTPAFGVLSRPAHAASTELAEKDLAILLPLESRQLIAGHERVGTSSSELFPQSWYRALENAYNTTAVGNALELENTYRDWKLVSARVVPCSPLGILPKQDPDTWCWPEVRLVWQPVLNNVFVFGRNMQAFADDRAVHALYDVEAASAGLSTSESARARTLLAKVRAGLEVSTAASTSPLNATERVEFVALRNKAIVEFIAAIRGLRSANVKASEFAGLNVRPETFDAREESAFRSRFSAFLARFSPAQNIKALTSFSLPEGRQPSLLDEWVFVSFKGVQGRIEAENILVRSADDGRVLMDLGRSTVATQRRDDDRIYDFLETNRGSRDAQEITNSTVLFAQDQSRLMNTIADRSNRFVPNVTCGSCHKLNNTTTFDFHNLSYLEDRPITVSPRVAQDVAHDLGFLKRANLP